MIIFTNFFIVIIIAVLIYIFFDSRKNDLTITKSSFDNRNYLVRNLPDSTKAANILAECRFKISKLIDYLLLNYGDQIRIKRFISKYNPNNYSETVKGSKYTSYSINKGEKIVVCLRTRDKTEKLIDLNTIMFVILHELAHIMTKSIGHTDEFWNNFKFILENAVKINIYNMVDYKKFPKKYCGIEVSDSPLFN